MAYNLLVLEDGAAFLGEAFGAPAPAIGDLVPERPDIPGAGELVFNTAMAGYHEVLTDPSYTGQIVTMTYPHMGNYGTADSWTETGPEQAERRATVKANAFVVRALYGGRVSAGRAQLHDFLERSGIPGIAGVDTRALTLRLRDLGSCNAVLLRAPDYVEQEAEELELQAAALARPDWSPLGAEDARTVSGFLQSFPSMEGRNLLGNVGATEYVVKNPSGAPHIAFFDCGTKAHIIDLLAELGARVSVFPSTAGAEEIRNSGADGCAISNGPGDPAVLERQVQTVSGLLDRMPLLGVCLGHQLIAEALQAKTYKMKFGHHGVNHPVRDEESGKVFVTSQNHGFAVDEASLPDDVTVRFRNANDSSVEGISSRDHAVLTAQFHPEAAPGPHDCRWIFREFVQSLS